MREPNRDSTIDDEAELYYGFTGDKRDDTAEDRGAEELLQRRLDERRQTNE